MTLFSLLLVMLAERLHIGQQRFQFFAFSHGYIKRFGLERGSPIKMLAMALLPALLLLWLSDSVEGMAYGLPNLTLWVVVGLLLFGHQPLRQQFRQFLQAACANDISQCHRLVQQMDPCHRQDRDEQALGQHMGELAAWINYRYYAAVALYFVCFGPAAALFYSLVRDIHDSHSRQGQPQLAKVLHLLDWLPARILALSFAFSGRFQPAIAACSSYLLSLSTPARTVVIEAALAAEELPQRSGQPVCIQPTIALLKLVKRNLMLLLMMVSVLTIFGVLQ